MIFHPNDRKLFVGPFSWPNFLSCAVGQRSIVVMGNNSYVGGQKTKHLL